MKFLLITLLINVTAISQGDLEKILFNNKNTVKKEMEINNIFPSITYVDSLDFFYTSKIDSISSITDEKESIFLFELYYQNEYSDSVYANIISMLERHKIHFVDSEYSFELKGGAFFVLEKRKLVYIKFNLCSNSKLRNELHHYFVNENVGLRKRLIINCGFFDYEEF